MLEYRNTKLAVVEAKAWDEGLTEGVAQAKNYAGKMQIRYTYSTNGRGCWLSSRASLFCEARDLGAPIRAGARKARIR